MDLDNLRAFIVFAKHLNFTHAAKELHLTQPALHSKVKSLSNQLRVKLYQRKGRQLVLTEDGLRVLAFGRKLNEDCETFYDELHGLARKEPIVLAAGEGAFLYLLANKLRAQMKESDAPLRLLTRDSEGTVNAVRSGEAHLGVVVLHSLPKGLEAKAIGSYAYKLAMKKNHPLAGKRKVKLADLDKVGLIVPQVGRPFRTFLEGQMRQVGASLEVAVEARGWNLSLHFVQQGMGAAIVNGCCQLPKGLVVKNMPELGQVTYYVIHRAGTKRDGPLALLLAKLTKN